MGDPFDLSQVIQLPGGTATVNVRTPKPPVERTAGTLNDRGLTKLVDGDEAGALADFDHARAALVALLVKVELNRSAALKQLGRLDDALAAVDDALRLDDQQPGPWVNRLGILCAGERLDAVADTVDTMLAHWPAWREDLLLRRCLRDDPDLAPLRAHPRFRDWFGHWFSDAPDASDEASDDPSAPA